MSSDPLSHVVDQFKSEPSRTGSLIVTFYGDTILPRGGSVWLGTILNVLELIDVDGGVVRTAVSRLAADGWLERKKIGRKSFYRLAAAGRDRFELGLTHVYRASVAEWTGRLALLLIENGADRDSSRAALSEAGFGTPMPGVWIAPLGANLPSGLKGVIRLEASAEDEAGRQLIEAAWPLAAIASSYRDFMSAFAPLTAWSRAPDRLEPQDAIVARVLLIHQYRRVLLRDPLLPAELLPSDWPGAEARRLCATIYRRLLPASERWLDEFGESASGKLPRAGKELAQRFAGAA